MRRNVLVVLVSLLSLAGAGCASSHVACPAIFQAAAEQKLPTFGPALAACPLKPPAPYPFQNLVLEGGGVKGIAYGGAFEALDQQGILDQLDEVAGTSAGAITAALLALRYSPTEIQRLMLSLDFSNFEDGGWTGFFRLFSRYGWYRGDYFLNLLRCFVGRQTGNQHATFAELHDGSCQGKPCRHLRVFATDLTTGRPQEFSYEKTPAFEVALAVRMSMSIPLFFASVTASVPDHPGNVFVDGGVQFNYPITIFDHPKEVDPHTLGLYLDNTGAATPDNQIHNLPDYLKYLLEAVLNEQGADLEKDPVNLERTVIIDNLGVPTTDFSLSTKCKLALIAQGVGCTCSYLRSWQAWQASGSHPSAAVASHERVKVFGFHKCGSAFDEPPAGAGTPPECQAGAP